MKNELEPLLNSLIERGWKPYGIEKDDIEVCEYSKDRKKISIGYMNWVSPSEGDYDWLFMSLRDVTSKESGLWQFVCENKLIKPQVYAWYFYREGMGKEVCKEDYEFRLIESSLKDESELEDFLLNSIKLD